MTALTETTFFGQVETWRANGVTADSRQVKPGVVFVALPGTKSDGRQFIPQAVAQGAAAIIAPAGTQLPEGQPKTPLLAVNEPRRVLALLATYFNPAQPRLIAAITGTNGKTSTADFLRQLWTLAGSRAASIGTLGVRAPDWRTETGLTTPDPVKLAADLARLASENVDLVAMEASSHGLEQCRLDGVRLSAGGFTNLTRDHLDYHPDMAAYRQAKLRLFTDLLPSGSPAVFNADMEPETVAALRDIVAGRGLKPVEVGEAARDYRLIEAAPLSDGQRLTLDIHGARRTLHLPVAGRFQVDNALLAAALAMELGLSNALDLLEQLHGVRGRMELAARLPNGAAAYVDYAHTPDALETLLKALRPHTQRKLYVVFGAGGDRDKGKRPLMGAAALQFADQVIVTDDNPRSEDPLAIRSEVIQGCQGAWSIPGRAEAIHIALNALEAGDVLVVAGKGHEQGQVIGQDIIPFDDASVIRSIVSVQGAAPDAV